MTLIRAILIMSRNPPSCESVLEPKATEATQNHPKATPRPHQSYTKATPRPLSSQLIRPVCKSEAQKPPVSVGPWPQCRGALKSVAASLNPKAENRNPKEE